MSAKFTVLLALLRSLKTTETHDGVGLYHFTTGIGSTEFQGKILAWDFLAGPATKSAEGNDDCQGCWQVGSPKDSFARPCDKDE